MKKLIIISFILFILVSYSFAQNIIKYPYILRPVNNDIKQRTIDEFHSINGQDWTITVDRFTGFLEYGNISGLPEKRNLTDYMHAINVADDFLKRNKKVIGIKEDFPKCIDVKGSESPSMGYVWLEYSGQYQYNMPVVGTKIVMKVDYPGIVRDIRARWYPDIKISEEEGIDKVNIKQSLIGRSMPYKGYGGQGLTYIIKETDLVEECQKVIFPFRKEKQNIVEFYITWKIQINKEEIRNAWNVYIDVFSGEDIYVKQNFK